MNKTNNTQTCLVGQKCRPALVVDSHDQIAVDLVQVDAVTLLEVLQGHVQGAPGGQPKQQHALLRVRLRLGHVKPQVLCQRLLTKKIKDSKYYRQSIGEYLQAPTGMGSVDVGNGDGTQHCSRCVRSATVSRLRPINTSRTIRAALERERKNRRRKKERKKE